ncbi:MAG: phosphoribosyltransferase [Treponema sp.]
MSKEFITYETLRNDGFRLARRIWDDGFVPNVLYCVLRGGSYLGNILHEWFKMTKPQDKELRYAAVVTHSYSDSGKQTKLVVDGWTHAPELLHTGDKILLVDDIFESGATMNYLVSALLEHGIPHSDIKIAVNDYKVFHTKDHHALVQPDYWCRKHDIYSDSDNTWIHYMSHELIGLSKQELEEYYLKQYPDLREVFEGVIL